MRLFNFVLLLVLFSCRSGADLTLKHTNEQCSPVFVYVDETQKLIDVDKSYCNVRGYEFKLQKVGPINGNTKKKPLPYCDRCTGFKDYSGAASFWEEVRQEINLDVAEMFK